MSPTRIVFAIAIAGLAGCTADPSGSPTSHGVPPLAYVRYYNAVGDTLPLDFRPVDATEYSWPFLATPFRAQGLGGYQGYGVGARHIRVFPNSTDLATTTSVLADTTMTLVAGVYYTFTHVGYARAGATPTQKLWITVDTFPSVTTGNVAFRVVHVGPDLGPVDVYITTTATEALPATPTFANVDFRQQTAYAQRPAGALVMRVYAAGNRTTALVGATTMSAGTAGTTSFNPIGGSGQAGTVATAMLYSRATAGSAASITSGSNANTTPKIYYWIDRHPPSTAP